MLERSTTILKNLIHSLRLSTSTDCSVVLIKSINEITFQSYVSNDHREFLEHRIKLIEWANFSKYAGAVCKKEIGNVKIYYKENIVFCKFLEGSILLVVMNNSGIDTSEITKHLNRSGSELKTFCRGIL